MSILNALTERAACSAGSVHRNILRLVRALLLALGILLLASSGAQAVDPPASGRHFDSLTVRGVTHKKVTVIDVAQRHVSFRSAQGFATVLLSDLEPDVRAKLGRGELDLSDAYREKPTPASTGGKPLVAKARETEGTDAEAKEQDEECEGGFFDQSITWTFKNIAAAGAVCLGLLVMFAAHCWFIGVAFRTSIAWGIAVVVGTFFAGIINWVFCCTHWQEARRPVYLNLAGIALACLGFFSFGS